MFMSNYDSIIYFIGITKNIKNDKQQKISCKSGGKHNNMNSDLGVVIKYITWTAGEHLENMLLHENC